MAKGHTQRRIAHQLVSNRNAFDVVRYKLQKVAQRGKSAEEKQTAFARVVAEDTVTEAQLAVELSRMFPGVNPDLMAAILNQLQEVLLQHLRAGRRVNFKDMFSFGLSFEGRLDPERPFDARLLPLSPWVRFAPNFLNRLNRKVKVAYNAPLLPPKVQVKKAEWFVGLFQLTGSFRNIEGMIADVIAEDGSEIPCKHYLSVTTRSHRHSGKTLHIMPEAKLACDETTHKLTQPYTLRLRWFDGANEEKTLLFDF